MKVRSLLLALALTAAFTTAAHAQGALYITPVFDHVSISPADPNPTFSFLGPTTTGRMFYGVQFGGFYNVPQENKSFEVGVDVRDAVAHGNNALLNSFLVGPRVSPNLANHVKMHPYVEPFVGAGSTRAPYTTVRVTKFQYGILGGLDYDLSKHVGFRVFEVGYSGLATAGSGTIGANGTTATAQILLVSTGLTLRLP